MLAGSSRLSPKRTLRRVPLFDVCSRHRRSYSAKIEQRLRGRYNIAQKAHKLMQVALPYVRWHGSQLSREREVTEYCLGQQIVYLIVEFRRLRRIYTCVAVFITRKSGRAMYRRPSPHTPLGAHEKGPPKLLDAYPCLILSTLAYVPALRKRKPTAMRNTLSTKPTHPRKPLPFQKPGP